ncbi:MAG: class I SAM-dependent methyltransferase [Candidatus Abyssubacteria bacterium]
MSLPPTIEAGQCKLCAYRDVEWLYPEFGMIRCKECGLVWTPEIPDPECIKQVYSETYFRSSNSGALGYDDYAADRLKISRTFHKRMAEIEKLTGKRGRLLDVGCALGFSLEVAKLRGWEAVGIEISDYACDYARQKLGVDAICGSLANIDPVNENFDVITMWDYIEHNPDPPGELTMANRLLKKGGLLAMTTPNIRSLPARIWGPRWMGIKKGEHLFYFSPETLRRLLETGGFEIIRMKHVGKYINVGFFIKRVGLYSATMERVLSGAAHTLNISDRVLYINPYDILLVYGRKTRAVT